MSFRFIKQAHLFLTICVLFGRPKTFPLRKGKTFNKHCIHKFLFFLCLSFRNCASVSFFRTCSCMISIILIMFSQFMLFSFSPIYCFTIHDLNYIYCLIFFYYFHFLLNYTIIRIIYFCYNNITI